MSKNLEAEKVFGLRKTSGFIMDEPCELGYHCPVCEYKLVKNGHYDERLTWSEYNGFLRCSVCNKDYPSCFCIEDNIDRAISIYLEGISFLLTKNQNDGGKNS